MQVFILFFLTTFSCGFAQEKNHPETEDNNLLTVGVNNLSSSEESRVTEDDEGASVYVEEILRELNEERAKIRDLNQTISDILERMADMERDISTMSEDVVSNRDDITVNQLKTELLTRDVGDLQNDVAAVQDDVTACSPG